MLAEVLARVAAAGTTLVVVTHELGALSGVLTRAVVADHGRIAHDGPLAGAGRAGSGLAGGSHHVDEPGPTVGARHGGLATPAPRLRGGGR
jgi:zinc transport system ATP-binding protein